MKYSEKLRDPRWQKMRLKVLERDEWNCMNCGDSEAMLMVHHYYYSKGCEPWEYPIEDLITYCSECHEIEHENMKSLERNMVQTLKEVNLNAEDIHGLMLLGLDIRRCGIRVPIVVIDMLTHFVNDEEYSKKMDNDYRVFLKKQNERKKERT